MRLFFLSLLVVVSHLLLLAQNDVDFRIAVNSYNNSNTFVVIIANEEYKYEQSVPFALNDGQIFKLYCEKTLGIPQINIRYVSNATLNDMRMQLRWLEKVMNAYAGEAKALVYYSGHGMPDEDSKQAYLLPVDGNSSIPESGLSTSVLYKQLANMPSTATMVLIDACFSGSQRDGKMLSASRGVAIKAKDDPISGNMVVFSAAEGYETAYPYQDKQHGLFTYYLLKMLQEKGGYVTLGDLSDYVVKQVARTSIVENDKSQTPSIIASPTATNWRSWLFAPTAAKHFETIHKTTYQNSVETTKSEKQPEIMPTPSVTKATTASPPSDQKSNRKAVLEDFVAKICGLYNVELSKTKMSDIEREFGVSSKKVDDKVGIHLNDGTEFQDISNNGVCNLISINPQKVKESFPPIDNMSWESSYKEWNEWFTAHGFEAQSYKNSYRMLFYIIDGLNVGLLFDGKESKRGAWYSLIMSIEPKNL